MSYDRTQQMTSASSIEECLDQIRFARAAELARTGSYLEAEALLSPNGRVSESPRELDLLARMAAQQERFEDAQRFWNAALKRDPDNADYRECLQQLSHIQAGGQPSGTSRTILKWCGLAVFAILMLIGLFLSTHRAPKEQPGKLPATTSANGLTTVQPSELATSPKPALTAPAQNATAEFEAAIHRMEQTLHQMQQNQGEQIQSLASQLTAIQATNSLLLADTHITQTRLADLARSVGELDDHHAAIQRATELTRSDVAILAAANVSAKATATNSRPLHPDLAVFNLGISGVTVASSNGAWLIRFEPGIFDHDDHFIIGAKARLQSVAKALVQTQARIKVEIIGLAEDEPPTWPWLHPTTPDELGLERAHKTTAFLRSLGIFPSDKLNAVSGTPSQRPFPTPNRNNRTVMLHVSPD